jgi:hypothetical protein
MHVIFVPSIVQYSKVSRIAHVRPSFCEASASYVGLGGVHSMLGGNSPLSRDIPRLGN